MRTFFASALMLAVAVGVAMIPQPSWAQNQPQPLPMPPGGFKPPPAAPVKPYKPVTVTSPGAFADPTFAAFRKQLAAVAERKDRAALAALVVRQGFFWVQDKDLADKGKSGVDNLAKAIDLDAKGGPGWDILAGYAAESTGEPLPDRRKVICAPAEPNIDPKAFEALLETTQTEPSEWGYPTTQGVEVRSAAQANAAVVDKLGMYLVRVLPDSPPPQNPDQPAFLHIALPSGKTGYVQADAVSGLGSDKMCYTKEAAGWKIVGYFGGAGE